MGRRGRIHRQVALPTEHGSWALYLVPLVMGIAAGGRPTHVTAYLVVASACGFLIRQPVTMLVKVRSGRKGKDFERPAWTWLVIYAVVGAVHVTGLVLRGFGFLLWLAVPGIAILVWHLSLIARRSERRQMGVEVVGAAFLALSAPAALWVAERGVDWAGGAALYAGALGFNAWLIVETYLRLAQRAGETGPWGAPMVTAVGTLGIAVVCAALGLMPTWVPLAFVIPPAATIAARLRPAEGRRPKQIGMEMLAISVGFTLAFVVLWHV